TQAVQEALQNSAQVVRLGTVKHEPRFTTREVFEIESSLLTTAEASKGKNAHTVRESNVLRAVLETQAEVTLRLGRKIELTPEQTGAVRKLTGASDQIAVLTGEAGSGKGVVASAATRAFELEGFRVIQAGGKSLTVERMLKDLDLGI